MEPEAQLLTLRASFSGHKQVFVTRDRTQLPLHMVGLLLATEKYVMHGIINSVDDTEEVLAQSVICRAHSILTRLLARAVCNGQLSSGIQP